MRRTLLLIVLVLLVGIAVSGPLFETVDHWDHFPQDDILLTGTILAVCLGTWLLGKPLVVALTSRFTKKIMVPVLHPSEILLYTIPPCDESPPQASLALRI
jgi:hypothetical protein